MFELQNYSYLKKIYPFEWVMALIYVVVIMIYVFFVQSSRIKKNPLYRFYSPAIFVKLLSGIVFCVIYTYYYEGGDTVNYYESARAIMNLGMQHPDHMMTVLTTSPSIENYSLFTSSTGYPHAFMYFDPNTFFVIKMIVPILYVSFRSYVLSSIVMAFLSFFGTWQLFLLLNRLYPGIEKRLAFAALFVPSVLFWGSGILKDTITFSAVCWF
ncbi:MAG TPA: hypothetical protein VL651_15030, partial [Bacteroidia bacterium]|nr:hypothetical protein [Bacteroidia bacterium]